MKLESKHLLPYLPYGVRFNGLRKGWAYPDVNYTLCLVDLTEDKYEYIKPILRPLSDLSEDFVSKSMIEEINKCSSNDIKYCLTYNQIDFLISLSFDVFGLIDKGLAINKNTLTPIK